MEQKHTIVIILEAKPDKQNELKEAIITAAKHSRLENANIEYRVHQSIDNPNQFVLYENWINQTEHQKQFDKPYIQAFANTLESILAKPYAVYMAEEINI